MPITVTIGSESACRDLQIQNKNNSLKTRRLAWRPTLCSKYRTITYRNGGYQRGRQMLMEVLVGETKLAQELAFLLNLPTAEVPTSSASS